METKHTLKACITGAIVAENAYHDNDEDKVVDIHGYGQCLLNTCKSIKDCGMVVYNDIYNENAAFMVATAEREDVNDPLTSYALTRIAPLAFINVEFFPRSTYPETISQVVGLTHTDPIVIKVCEEYIYLLNDIIHRHLDKNHSEYIRERFSAINEPEAYIKKDSNDIRDVFFAALWCFVNTTSYSDCINRSLSICNNSVVPCVAGALAGCYYGIDNIPKLEYDIDEYLFTPPTEVEEE